MSAFTKLDSGIVHSTIWVQPHDVLRVWIALLALADQNGFARTAAPSLAHLCMVPLDRMREILVLLESPDEDSRSDVEDGRRIVKVEGGWLLVNHAAYRAKRDPDSDRDRKREWDREHRPSGHARAKQSDSPTPVRPQSDASPPSPTQAEAEADTEAREQKPSARQAARCGGDEGRFPEWWAAYPKHVARKKALAIWQRRKLDAIADRLILDVMHRRASDDGWQRGYVPDPTTYLNQDRWNDDLRTAPTARAGPSPPQQQSKTLSAIQTLQGMKHGQLAAQRDSGRLEQAAVLELGQDAGR